jgi:hypothetical protein
VPSVAWGGIGASTFGVGDVSLLGTDRPADPLIAVVACIAFRVLIERTRFGSALPGSPAATCARQPPVR